MEAYRWMICEPMISLVARLVASVRQKSAFWSICEFSDLRFVLREEQEKLNVWVALLNLENMYGTDEALMKVFERAIQYNEPLKVFQQLADIYTSSEKYKVGLTHINIIKRIGRNKAGSQMYVMDVSIFQTVPSLLFSFQQADDLYNIMLKRFRQEKCVWVKYATFLLKRGLVEAAHRLLPRALKCLPDKERKAPLICSSD